MIGTFLVRLRAGVEGPSHPAQNIKAWRLPRIAIEVSSSERTSVGAWVLLCVDTIEW
jgi:hypothetical protein